MTSPSQNNSADLILGAVAYDQKVVPICDGFQQHFRTRGVVETGGVAERIMTPAHSVGEARAKAGLALQVLAEMCESERDMSRLVLSRKPGHCRRHRIGRIAFDEPQQRQERAFTQHPTEGRNDSSAWGLQGQKRRRCPRFIRATSYSLRALKDGRVALEWTPSSTRTSRPAGSSQWHRPPHRSTRRQ